MNTVLNAWKLLLSSKEDKTFLKKYFSLSVIIQWNNLDLKIRNSRSLDIFRNRFIPPSANSVFNSHSLKAINFITILRLVLSHLWEHKFKHSFQDLLNPISNCGLGIESSLHYLLYGPTYNTERHALLCTLEILITNF